MRVVLIALLFMLPSVTAEFGPETETGWPIGEGGVSHDPVDAFAPEYLAMLQAEAGINQVGPATLYPYYPIAVAEIQRLAEEYPNIVRLHEDESTLGLTLFTLEIGNFHEEGTSDFVALVDRETVWIDGGTHSNEYSGVYFTLAVAQYLIESYGEDEFATWVLDNRHTYIMPMLNPDGSNAMGRLNANLVNINRNYPVLWGGDGTDMHLNNPGPSAASEIETQVSIEWFERVMPDYAASIHCCGNLWLAPYGEEGYDPIDLQVFETICDNVFADVRDDCGPIWSTIYPASGSNTDTCYEYTGGACFGFEMSGRSNLVGIWGEPITFQEVFEQERESWGAVQHAFENVHLYGAHLEANLAGDVLQLTNTGYGNATRVNVTLPGGSIQTFAHIPVGATVEVPLEDASGEATLSYAKRVQAEPMRTVSFELSSIDVDGDTVKEAPVPAILALAGLAVALVLKRR